MARTHISLFLVVTKQLQNRIVLRSKYMLQYCPVPIGENPRDKIYGTFKSVQMILGSIMSW
jgi:hypothetical protein